MTGSTGWVLVEASRREAEYKLGMFSGLPRSIQITVLESNGFSEQKP